MAEFNIPRIRYRWKGYWTTTTAYIEDDIVFYAGSSWACIRPHTSGNFNTDQTYLADPLDSAASSAWTKVTDGYKFRGVWASSTIYGPGDIAIIGGNLYLCTTGHTSALYFETNITDWDIFIEGNNWRTTWTPNSIYKTGDVVAYNGIVYRCVREHVAGRTEEGIIIGDGDSTNDSTAETWEIVYDNVKFVGPYAINTRYRVNDLVKYGGSILRCIEEHTSSSVAGNIDNNNFTTEFRGFNFYNNWSNAEYYAIGDVVRHGGYVYVSGANNINSEPGESATYSAGNPNWTLITKAINLVGTWDNTQSYKAGDLVRRGGQLYVATVNTIADGSSLDYLDSSNWELLAPGQEWKGTWVTATEYEVNDIVYHIGSTYICNISHLSMENTYPGDNGSGYNYWSTLIAGGDVGTQYPGDMLIYGLSRTVANDGSTVGPTRIAIATEDEVLKVGTDATVYYDPWGTFTRIFHIRPDGVDDDTDVNRGVNYFKPWKTIHFAARKANDGYLGTTTIKVWPGIYKEVLPIIVPQNTAIDGAELRAVTIKPNDPSTERFDDRPAIVVILDRFYAIMNDLLTGVPITKSITNTETQYIPVNSEDYSTLAVALEVKNIILNMKSYINYNILATGIPPVLTGSMTVANDLPHTRAVMILESNRNFLAEEAVAFINELVPSYQYDEDRRRTDIKRYVAAWVNDITYTGNYKALLEARWYVNDIIGSASEDMFYVRDSSGIRNATLSGLTGTLSPNNEFELYQRPNGGSFVSLDPGWGPDHEDVWIINRSPYIQNVTNFGTAATGQKIDGNLHNGGNKSITSNDFTQVISDGIGAHVLNDGRAELVSVFTYYAHIGMFAEDGGTIRATNGNSSYGAYGVIADGNDPAETPAYGYVNNRTEEAQVANAFAGEINDEILIVEFSNAGQEYTNAVYTVVGSGTGASLIQEEFRDNSVFEAQVRNAPGDPGGTEGAGDYILAGNNAQFGDTLTITLATNDGITAAEILGTRIILTSGEGTGQYGYVQAYNESIKQVTVYRESDGQPGWDHVIPGTPSKDPLTTGTRYLFEPRISFSAPPFSAELVTSPTTAAWAAVAYGETLETYSGVGGSVGEGTTLDVAPLTALWNVTKNGRSYIVTLLNGGAGYADEQVITIDGSDVGGTDIEHDITITVKSISDDSTNSILTFEYEGIAASGRFVMTPNNGGFAVYSSNGSDWLASPLPVSGNWKSIATGNNKFVAIRFNSANAILSTDGITWNSTALPSTSNWNSVSYGLASNNSTGLFFAVSGQSDAGAYTLDGATWLSTTLPNVGDSTQSEWKDVAYGKGVFVAIANSSNAVAVGSYNAATDVWTWTGVIVEVQDSTPEDWSSIAYGNGRFVIVSTSGDVSYSFDGQQWYTTSAGMPQSAATEMYWKQLRYGQGVFFAVCETSAGSTTTFAATSYDGIVWTSRTLAATHRWGVIGFGNPDISLGDSTVSNNRPMWIAAPSTASSDINRIFTGARTLGRAVVSSGNISEIKLWEPGSGYISPPTVTFTDPNNTYDAYVNPRLADGVLAQPTFLNKGAAYRTSTTVITVIGNGFADIIPRGRFITLSGLARVPGPGAQFRFGGRTDAYTVVVTGIDVTPENGTLRSTFQISPVLTYNDDIRENVEVEIREKYSQVRITGHDFLDIGTGNFEETNYPTLYSTGNYTSSPENEVEELNGGRVFYTSTDQSGNFRTGELFAVEQATGIVTISADFFELQGLTELALGGVRLGGSGAVVREFSTDALFIADSNNVVPTQRAIKSYLATRLNIGGSDLLTSSFIAGTVRVGPNLVNSTAELTIDVPVMANFSGAGAGINGMMVAASLFYCSFRDDV
jgi:hypothetical protein